MCIFSYFTRIYICIIQYNLERSNYMSEIKTMYDAAKKEYDLFVAQKLKLNMARGKPGSDQLDLTVDALNTVTSTSNFLHSSGEDFRNYGMWDGLPEMKDIFASMMDVPAKNIIIGNNSSLSLMFEVISRGYSHGYNGCKAWGKQENVKFLCPVPGYDRHFAITEYFGIEMINIPMDENGPDMAMVADLVSKDESIKGIWCVPKYSNPAGLTYSADVVKAFAKLKPMAKDFKIMWDNAYCVHDLSDTPDTLLSLFDECVKESSEDMVFIFSSTSKITFPGAGVAAMAGSESAIKELEGHFTIKSIGPDKLNELRHLLFLKDFGGVLTVMQGHKEILQPKFNTVCSILNEELGGTGLASWNEPNGGYFVCVDVMEGCAKRVVQLCKEAGVVLTGAGATYPYGKDPKDSNIRIAPTFPPVAELKIAMKLFCICVKLAAAEKQLGN